MSPFAPTARPAVPADTPPDGARRPRIMVVDDAVVVRGLVSRWLEEAGCDVVATHRNGRLAVDDVARADPDVVILDVEMPEMDGIQALPLLLQRKACTVIMASTLTRRNAELSLRCLALGATDTIAKPEAVKPGTERTGSGEMAGAAEFRRELVDKVLQLARRQPRARGVLAPVPAASPPAPTPASPAPARTAEPSRPMAPPRPAAPSVPRTFSSTPPRVLLVGSSTGGPQALDAMLTGLVPLIDRMPVLVTQHMPATFTTILAEHLARATGRPVAEAQHGEPIQAGHVYVAPGGRHMLVRGGAVPSIALDDGPMVNYCRPAVDPLFTTGSEVYGRAALAVVLTGMGSDGLSGAARLVEAGGSLVAQDEASSVVWGMPGAVAQAGLCAAVLPLPQIAPRLLRLLAGDRS